MLRWAFSSLFMLDMSDSIRIILSTSTIDRNKEVTRNTIRNTRKITRSVRLLVCQKLHALMSGSCCSNLTRWILGMSVRFQCKMRLLLPNHWLSWNQKLSWIVQFIEYNLTISSSQRVCCTRNPVSIHLNQNSYKNFADVKPSNQCVAILFWN